MQASLTANVERADLVWAHQSCSHHLPLTIRPVQASHLQASGSTKDARLFQAAAVVAINWATRIHCLGPELTSTAQHSPGQEKNPGLLQQARLSPETAEATAKANVTAALNPRYKSRDVPATSGSSPSQTQTTTPIATHESLQ